MSLQIQVIEDDRRNRSGPFHANQKGILPPLVTTQFTTQDQGMNACEINIITHKCQCVTLNRTKPRLDICTVVKHINDECRTE